ncbi:MAG: DUF362 domain-containing protein, partial [Rikenellaceae bacterium]|nr:DUF362 domain-containing protein [Rikenellaceae bacterium]
MKIFNFLVASLFVATACCSCGNTAPKAEEPATPKVYMTTDISPEGLVKVYEALGREAEGRVAVKISTGEPGGKNFLKPELIGALVQKVNGTIVECNTAYKGPRFTAEAHMQVAKDHGFCDIAEVDIMDAEGDMLLPVKDTSRLKHNIVGAHLANYDFMINLAHFKGHTMGGFGGVLKNQSIGVASTIGKVYIHSAGRTTDLEKFWDYTDDQIGFLESMAVAAESVHAYFGEGERI